MIELFMAASDGSGQNTRTYMAATSSIEPWIFIISVLQRPLVQCCLDLAGRRPAAIQTFIRAATSYMRTARRISAFWPVIFLLRPM